MRTTTILGALVVCIALFGCDPVAEVETRESFWTKEVDTFFQKSRTMDALHSWLRARNIFYTFEESDIVDGKWAMTLEKIYPDSFRCEWVDIVLNVVVDNSHGIQTYSLDRKRACLW